MPARTDRVRLVMHFSTSERPQAALDFARGSNPLEWAFLLFLPFPLLFLFRGGVNFYRQCAAHQKMLSSALFNRGLISLSRVPFLWPIDC